MKRYTVLAILAMLSCTDAECAQATSYGSGGKVVCYSGGAVVYDGKATGKVLTEEQSDGWYFREEGSGDLIRTNADCVIRN